jgi:hypothetical protein
MKRKFTLSHKEGAKAMISKENAAYEATYQRLLARIERLSDTPSPPDATPPDTTSRPPLFLRLVSGLRNLLGSRE